ncbi:Uncharacterised protein [Mycobacterium tuberculosis]|nr:Uncharacterised protein [Mycobacterium tuberculosis]
MLLLPMLLLPMLPLPVLPKPRLIWPFLPMSMPRFRKTCCQGASCATAADASKW